MKRQQSCDSCRAEEHFKRTKGPDGAGERPVCPGRKTNCVTSGGWSGEMKRGKIYSEKAEVLGRRNKKGQTLPSWAPAEWG